MKRTLAWHRPWWRALLAVAAVVGLAGPQPASHAASQTPENFPQIRRELRIGADVLRSALTELLKESRLVVNVEAGYLAGQGVLVMVDLASPWLGTGPPRTDLGPDVTSLEQIPAMVHDILAEMDLGLPPRQVEDLEELREIGDAQRAVRAEQRSLRAELRQLRRELLRVEDQAAGNELRRRIDALQARQADAQVRERALSETAARVRGGLDAPEPVAADGQGLPSGMDRAVAASVCSYGDTFKSPGNTGYLNVLVRRGDVSRYYVFEMAQVRECQSGEGDAIELLESSFRYQS